MILNNGTVVANRYEILEEIGVGGMSRVYRAIDKKLHRNVTFKVLREEFIGDENFVNRFEIEARAIASLNHPNIVDVYDVGSEGDINFIVMEYIHGKTLKDLILEKAPFTNETMLGVTSQITAALIHAHENGIIHRDIKPQNILCMANGVVKVADFGIARSHNSRKKNDDFSTMGSVHYISPEVACSDPIDPRSDLYSLGIVMYEMMTGELPFDSDDPEQISVAHIEAQFPSPGKKNPEILPIVREIITRLTKKQPFRRYQSANSLYNDIQRAIMECTTDNEENIDTYSRHETNRTPANRTPRLSTKSPADRRRERFVIIGGVTTAVIVLIGLFWIVTSLLLNSGDDSLTVTVPVLVGTELDAAMASAERVGIILTVAGTEYHEEIPEGFITEANAAAGAQVEPGAEIAVLVSLGPPPATTVEVPDVVGMNLDAAVQMIIAMGGVNFSDAQTAHEPSSTVPQNHIISQYPAPGTIVDIGTTISIIVSAGDEIRMIPMPNIIGLDEQEARGRIAQSGLTIGTTTSQHHPLYPSGIVISQSVTEGTMRIPGSSVDFIVSLGVFVPPPVETDDDNNDADDDLPTGEDNDENNGQDENGGDEPSGETPAMINRTLTIQPSVPSGVTVRLSVYRVNPDATLTLMFSDDVTADDFIAPMGIPVHAPVGSGVVEFIVFVNGTQFAGTLDFGS